MSQKHYINCNKFDKIKIADTQYKLFFGESLMLIMREPGSENKIQFRIRMTESVYKEIDDYCQWAGIRVRDYFIEKACQHIFKNDEDWLNFKKNRETTNP